jgi:hypothetical protein
VFTEDARVTLASALVRGGVLIAEGAEVSVQDSEIVNPPADGLRLAAGGSATLTRCRLRGAGRHGVSVERGARVALTECEVLGSAGDGVRLDTHEPVLISRSTIRDSGGESLRRLAEPDRVVLEHVTTGRPRTTARSDQPPPTRPEPAERPEPPGNPARTEPSGPLAEPNSLIGPERVKGEATAVINLIRMPQRRQEMGPPMSRATATNRSSSWPATRI